MMSEKKLSMAGIAALAMTSLGRRQLAMLEREQALIRRAAALFDGDRSRGEDFLWEIATLPCAYGPEFVLELVEVLGLEFVDEYWQALQNPYFAEQALAIAEFAARQERLSQPLLLDNTGIFLGRDDE